MVALNTPIDAKAVLARHLAAVNANDAPSRSDALADLSGALRAAGMGLKHMPVLDGEIHRLPDIHSKKRNDDSCWYVARELDNGLIYASYGNWRGGEQGEWNSRGETHQLSAADRTAMERARLENELKYRAKYEIAAQQAAQSWTVAEPANKDHPYLIKKKIHDCGLRQIGDELIVPVYVNGEIASLQRINGDGVKLFMKGGQAQGGYFQIGSLKERIYLVEGFATGASVHEATGDGVIVAFNAGNLLPVAQYLRKTYNLPIVIAGDDDRLADGNPGRTKAAAVSAQVENVTCLFPVFPKNQDGTDFNDMLCQQGVDAVCKILNVKISQSLSNVFTFDSDFDPANIPERPWLIPGVLMRGYVTVGVAPPGVGKSMFAMMMAVMVATGQDNFDA